MALGCFGFVICNQSAKQHDILTLEWNCTLWIMQFCIFKSMLCLEENSAQWINKIKSKLNHRKLFSLESVLYFNSTMLCSQVECQHKNTFDSPTARTASVKHFACAITFSLSTNKFTTFFAPYTFCGVSLKHTFSNHFAHPKRFTWIANNVDRAAAPKRCWKHLQSKGNQIEYKQLVEFSCFFYSRIEFVFFSCGFRCAPFDAELSVKICDWMVSFSLCASTCRKNIQIKETFRMRLNVDILLFDWHILFPFCHFIWIFGDFHHFNKWTRSPFTFIPNSNHSAAKINGLIIESTVKIYELNDRNEKSSLKEKRVFGKSLDKP